MRPPSSSPQHPCNLAGPDSACPRTPRLVLTLGASQSACHLRQLEVIRLRPCQFSTKGLEGTGFLLQAVASSLAHILISKNTRNSRNTKTSRHSDETAIAGEGI